MKLLRIVFITIFLLSIVSIGQVSAANITAEGELRPGQTTDLDVTVTTSTEQTNFSVELDIANSTTATLSSDSISFGTVDGSKTETIQISTPLSEKDPTSVELNYNSDSESGSEIIQLSNAGKQYFKVVNTNFDAPIGDPGNTEITIENVSSQRYSNARVTFDTSESPISIPDDQKTVYLGEVSANAQETFTIESTVSENANSNSTYQLSTEVTMTTASGSTIKEPLYVELKPTEREKIKATIEDTTTSVGGSGIVEIDIENSKDRDLSNVSVNLTSLSEDLQFSNSSSKTITVGDINAGESETISVTASFSETSVEEYEYQIESNIEYTYEESDLDGSDMTTLNINPEESTESLVQLDTQNIPVGGNGTATFTFTNTKSSSIEDIQVTLQTENQKVSFGEQSTTSQSFDQLDPGESITFTEDIEFTDSASVSSNYSITSNTQYSYTDINEELTEDSSILIQPISEQNVNISISTEESFTEGTSFDLPVVVENTGPKDIEKVEFTINPRNDTTVKRNVFSLGSIQNGESRVVQVPVETPLQSETLEQEFNSTVEYEYTNLDTPNSVSEVLQLRLNELDSEFKVTTKDTASISKGASEVITIQVTNQLNEPVTNVDSEFSASSPLSISDSNAYVREIKSGETVEMNVNVSASSGATVNPYPLDVDFQYDNSDGNAQLSEVYSLQVNVTDSEDQSFIIPVIIGVVISIILGLGVYYRDPLKQKIK